MKIVLGVLLLAHGVAHLVGFLVPWRLFEAADLPYGTTIFAGRVDLGPTGIRLLGLVWLVVALAFAVSAVAVWTATPRALSALLPLVLASLALCAAGWPAAKIGVPVNLGLLALLGLNRVFDWL
jgi:hypothetical protein